MLIFLLGLILYLEAVNDLYMPNSEDKMSYKLYDMRVGFHFDIFYQAFSIEYGIFTKQLAISFIPLNIRF